MSESAFDFRNLYGNSVDVEAAEAGFDSLRDEHSSIFGCPAQYVFSTAGRTELGGNHTDHNLGKVIAASISLDTVAAVHVETESVITFISDGYDPVAPDVSDLDPVDCEKGTTASLIRGIASGFVKRGGMVGGFSANVRSRVLSGSGMSSSASVEVLIASIFNTLFNENRFSTTDLAVISQEAENVFFGKPCGLMDQIACANGGIVVIDFKDVSNPVITPLKADFRAWGYDLVIVNTRSAHDDLTADYAAIPAEMKLAAGVFGKTYLREVDPAEFEACRDRVAALNERAADRAEHFFNENSRVDAMLKAIEENDCKSYLELVNQSGRSSEKLLKNICPAGCSSNAVSQALEATARFLCGDGAYRVHGGGFAGTIQAYIPLDKTERYVSEMEGLFGKGCCTVVEIRNLPTCSLGV